MLFNKQTQICPGILKKRWICFKPLSDWTGVPACLNVWRFLRAISVFWTWIVSVDGINTEMQKLHYSVHTVSARINHAHILTGPVKPHNRQVGLFASLPPSTLRLPPPRILSLPPSTSPIPPSPFCLSVCLSVSLCLSLCRSHSVSVCRSVCLSYFSPMIMSIHIYA